MEREEKGGLPPLSEILYIPPEKGCYVYVEERHSNNLSLLIYFPIVLSTIGN